MIASLVNARINQLFIVTPERVQSAFAPLLTVIKGQFIELGADGRGAAAFNKILLNIGHDISLATRVG